MNKVVEMLIEKCLESVLSLGWRALLRYDKSEINFMGNSITKLSLRENEHLERRQYSFMFKSLLISLVISYIMVVFMPNVVSKLVSVELDFVGLEGQYRANMVFILERIWLLCSSVILHTLLFMHINESFRDRTYGYGSIRTNSRILYRYNSRANIINILFFVVNCCFVITRQRQIAYMLYGILVLGTLLYYIHCIIKKKESIFSVYVREQGSKETADFSNNIDGENDINIICTDGTPIKVNLFKENMYIVEDNNILLLGKGVNNLILKNRIRKIDVDNKMGIHFIVQYDHAINKWVKR